MILWHILWPTFAFVLLVFVVWSTLIAQRIRHLKRVPPGQADFASSSTAARYFEAAGLAGDNLRNLFEMPVLFLALIPLLTGTRQAGIAQVLLAWIFVVLRAVHSWMHIHGRLRPRMRIYLASTIVLAAMWVGFFIDFAIAAARYEAVLDALSPS